MNRLSLLFVPIAGWILFALPACNTEPGPARPTVTSAVAPTTAPIASAPPARIVETPYANAPISDAKLAHGIEEAISSDPFLASQPIHVSVANSDVTLTGTVPTLAATWRLARLVEGFRGATSVTNQVAVNTPTRPDADIAKDVNDAIKSDRATRSAKVKATVNAETVTLTGTADSRAQRELLLDVASHVRGVQQVNATVAVAQITSRGDAEIAADAKETIAEDARLDGTHVVVEVRGRAAAISGVVGSLAQRDAAVEDTWVEGVTNVDAGGLRVDWVALVPWRKGFRTPVMTDTQIADAMRHQLSKNLRVGVQLPSVSVGHGVITLAGKVMDFRAKNEAIRAAGRMSGGWRLDDQMTVLPAERESDATIERQATRAIYNDIAAPGSGGVQLTTLNARVTLQGPVASPEEKTMIERDVEEVPGVVAVENDLKVQGYGPLTVIVAPESIRHAAIENIFWDPRVDASRVAVAVSPSGDITLTGTVDSWTEAQAVNGDAIRAGAAHVINSIRVADAPAASH